MVKIVSKPGPSPKFVKNKTKNRTGPAITKRKLMTYSPSKVKCALTKISEGMALSKASRLYGVPRATLWNKVNNRAPQSSGHVGFVSVLPIELEAQLEKWVLEMSDKGFPITSEILVDSVEQLVKEKNLTTPFTNNRPGRKWVEAFLRRHPAISKKQAEGLTSSRANVTEAMIRTWFSEVETSIKSEHGVQVFNDIFKDSQRVFNIDETALFLSPKGGTVLGRRGHSVFNVSKNNEKSCITTTICVNAKGDVINPCILFPYKRLPASIQRNAPPNWGLGITDNGWMTGEAFFEFISNVFYPYLIENNIPVPVVVFLDGHTSHLTIHLHNFCVKKKIILVALPPNATHLLQPLDVAVFRPLKVTWKKVVRDWKIRKGEEVTKENFCLVLQEAIFNAELQKSVESGFRTTGLYPFNQNAVNYCKLVQGKTQPSSSHQQEGTQLEKPMGHLEYLESKISEELLRNFQQTWTKKGDWEGPREASLLYEVWVTFKTDNESEKIGYLQETENGTACDQSDGDVESTNQDSLGDFAFGIENEYDVDNPDLPQTNAEREALELDLISSNNGGITLTNELDISMTDMIKDAEIIFADDDIPLFTIEEDFNKENKTGTEPKISEKKSLVKKEISPLRENNLSRPNEGTETACSSSLLMNEPQPSTSSAHPKPACVRDIFNGIHFWPGEDKKTPKRKPAVRMPSVVTSQTWKKYFDSKEKEKKAKEEEKIKKREERTAKKCILDKKTNKLGLKVNEDWICARCNESYNKEKKLKIPKKWIECDNCKRTLHYKCIPKVYLESWDITEEDLDKKTVDFQCHICIEEDGS